MRRFSLVVVVLCVLRCIGTTYSQNYQTFDATTTNAFTVAKWTAPNATNACNGGAKASNFTSGNIAYFCTPNGTGSGAVGITVGGIIATENYTHSTPSGTLATGGTIATVDVASGKAFDLAGASLSTAAGTGFIKNGNGSFATSGGTYMGGFTLNAGTIVCRGTNAMGSGGSLTINGGIIAANGNRDFTGKFAGMNVNANFTLGSSIAPAVDNSNLTFSNSFALNGNRTITIGGTGSYNLNGVISGAGNSLAVNANAAGILALSAASTFNGSFTFNGIPNNTGSLVRLSNGATLSSTSDIFINGGRVNFNASQSANNITVASGADLFVNTNVTLTINGTLTIAGGATVSGGGTIAYGPMGKLVYSSGTTAQTTTDKEWPATMATPVTINNSNGVILNSSKTQNASLTFTSGKLTLGANNLTIGSSGSILGASSTSYVVTDGIGTLTLPNVSASPVVFPIGPTTSLYHPVTITNSGTADAFSAKVSSAVPSCLLSTTSVNATWDIAEAVAGGSNCTLSFEYTGATTGSFYTAGTAKINHCTGTTADYKNGSVTGNIAAGSGFTTFSPFGIASPAIDMSATALVSPISGCKTSPDDVIIRIKNNSTETIDFSVNNVTVSTTATGGYSSSTILASGTLASNDSQDVTMPATVNLTAGGFFTFNASTSVSGDLNTSNDAMTPVVISATATPTTANAGPDQTGVSICGLTTVTLAANTPTVGIGMWTASPSGTFSDATSPTSTFTGTAGTSYTLTWTISNSPCTASTDDVVITFNQNPSTSNAGPDQTGTSTCGLTTVTLAANMPTVGTGMWTSSASGTFSDATSPTSTFTGTAGTSYTLTWTISNVPCVASTDEVVITFNVNPTASIVGTTTFCGSSSTTLTASGGSSYLWSNGTNTAATSINTYGLFTVTVTDNNGCTDTESVTTNQTSTASNSTSGIFESYVVIGTQFYDLQNSTSNPDFSGANLGSFTNGATLNFSGGQIKTYKNSGDNFCGGKIWYRVYPSMGTPGTFASVNLPFQSNLSNPGDQQWGTSSNMVNLLSSLSPGDYSIAVYVDASGNMNGATACSCDPYRVENNSGNFWIASFKVCAAATCPTYQNVCLNANPITLSGATPSGGTYSGTGVSNGVFTPINAGAGTHSITYTYNDGNGCSGACSFDITVKPTKTASVNASACSNMLPYVWNGQSLSTTGTYTDTRLGSNGCDSTTTLVFTVKQTNTGFSNHTACNTLTIGGQTYTTSGMHNVTYTNAAGCDSVHTYNVTINTGTFTSATVAACNTYTWVKNNMTYTASGTYVNTYNNANGCASADTLKLTINMGTFTSATVAACNTYTWAVNNMTYTTSSTYVNTYYNSNGCASADTLKLTINMGTFTSATVAACNTYTWAKNNITYTTSGTYVNTYNDSNGCASADTLKLTINMGTFTSATVAACNTYTWAKNNMTYTASGTYVNTYNNSNGCASADTLKLTINMGTFTSATVAACNTYTWAKNNMTYTTSGTYLNTYNNTNGCASADTLKLTIKNSTSGNSSVTACNTTTLNGYANNPVTTSGAYTATFTNAVGCDSIHTYNVTIKYSTMSVTNHFACDSFQWNGINYTTSGNYTYTTTNAVGCDSIAKLNLTVKKSTIGTSSVTSCDSLIWEGTKYITSGVYTKTLNNAAGCDSIHTLTLTIKHSTVVTTTQIACDSFTWYGVKYTTSGTYKKVFTNAVGCDSIQKLNLTINYSTVSSNADTVCNSFYWEGVTYTQSGVYTRMFTNAAGCPLTHTLYLTVNHDNAGSSLATACNNYIWSGTNYNSSGVYMKTFINAGGCDSVHTLTLTINKTKRDTFVEIVCPYDIPYSWNGMMIPSAGIYSDTLVSEAGCDSIVTLVAVFNAQPIAVLNYTTTMDICKSAPIVLDASASTGVDPVVVWYKDGDFIAAGQDTLLVSETGAYFARVKAQGCSDTSAIVQINATGNMTMNTNNSGTGSLRRAIECALPGDTIFIDFGLLGMIDLTESLNIAKPLTIGNESMMKILNVNFSAIPSGYGINIAPNIMVNLRNLDIHQSNNTLHLPLIQVEGQLKTYNVKTSN